MLNDFCGRFSNCNVLWLDNFLVANASECHICRTRSKFYEVADIFYVLCQHLPNFSVPLLKNKKKPVLFSLPAKQQRGGGVPANHRESTS
jgi:hypothetical protein